MMMQKIAAILTKAALYVLIWAAKYQPDNLMTPKKARESRLLTLRKDATKQSIYYDEMGGKYQVFKRL